MPNQYGMEKTFVNPLCLPEYPLSPSMPGMPAMPAMEGPFGMGPMIAKGLPPTHQRFKNECGVCC